MAIRVLNAIVATVPVRLMKRDLLFIVDSLLRLLDERGLVIVARSRGIRPADGESIGKLINAFIQKADEHGREVPENFANEDPSLVPTDDPAVVYPPRLEWPGILEACHVARQHASAGHVDASRRFVG
jgi:hypothetical protein